MPDTPDILQAKQNQTLFSQVNSHNNFAWKWLNVLNDAMVYNWCECWSVGNEWFQLVSIGMLQNMVV